MRPSLTSGPDSPDGLRNVAHVLAERLHQPDAAIDALTRSLDANPSDSAAFAGRAVLHARAGRGDLATSDIDAALELSSDALTQYQAACVYALLSADNDSARTRTLSLLAACFRQRPELAPFSRRDADLALLHGDPEYAGLVRASELLRATENGTARPASRLHADP